MPDSLAGQRSLTSLIVYGLDVMLGNGVSDFLPDAHDCWFRVDGRDVVHQWFSVQAEALPGAGGVEEGVECAAVFGEDNVEIMFVCTIGGCPGGN